MNIYFEELKASANLPSPAGIALEIIRLTQDSNLNLDDLVRPVQADPVLTGRVLKMANSVNNNPSGAMLSVREALMKVGTSALAHLALSLSIMDRNRGGICEAFDYDFYWSTSLLRGLSMRLLSQHKTVINPDEAFSIGLVAQIGHLALAQIYPNEYTLCLQEKNKSLLTIERETFMIDHQQISQAMLEEWGVPEWIVTALAESWAPQECNFNDDSKETTLAIQLRLASILAGDHGLNGDISDLSSLLNYLKLSYSDFDEIRNHLFEEWCHWGKLLCIPTVESFGNWNEAAEASPQQTNENSLNILIVEDDRTELQILSTCLKQQGHRVLKASDGNQALRELILQRPQIIITDYQMEPMDGLTLTRALKSNQETQSIYVILVTAEKDPKTMAMAFDAGVNDFISKPIRHEELIARIIGAQRALRQQTDRRREQENIRRQAIDLASAKRRVEFIAITDSLTGLPNRRHAMSKMDQEWNHFLRNGRSLAILSLDLDHFKIVNDNHGHDAGDAVLQHFASILRQSIRSEDTACRMGGEEFIVIAPNKDIAMLRTICERIRARVEMQQPEHLKLSGKITVSIGAAIANLTLDREGWVDTLKRSDQALYQAKQSGRNNVIIDAT